MKVLIISAHSAWPAIFGGPVQVYKTAKYLAEEFDIHLLCPISDENKKHLEEDAKIKVCSFSRMTLLFILFNRVLRRLRFPDIFAWLYNPFVYGDVKRALDRINPDLIHCIYLHTAPNALKAAKKSKLPFILTEPDVEYLREKRKKEILGSKASDLSLDMLKKKERDICNNSDLVVVLSDFDKKILRDIGVKAKIKAIFNGIDYAAYQVRPEIRGKMREKYSIGEDDIVLFYHGTFFDEANEDALNTLTGYIYDNLIAKHDNLKLVVMGPGVKERNIDLRDAIAIPTVPFDEVPKHLSMADIACVPLRFGTGVRLKIVEYMASGIPTISTKIGAEGLPVTHGKDIILVDDGNEIFLKELECLVGDPSLRKKLRENAMALAKERFDWRVLIKDYEQSYKMICSTMGP